MFRYLPVFCGFFLCSSAFAQILLEQPPFYTPLCRAGESCFVVTPLYSQVLVAKYPINFMQVEEIAVAGKYAQQHVLEGETVSFWSQMITIGAHQDVALRSDMTPEQYALRIAKMVYASCPDTFSGLDLGGAEIDGREAYLNVVGCGTVSEAKQHSEATLFIVIKASRDYYILQWAERGEASSSHINLDSEMWVERFGSLMPLKVCDVVPDKRQPVPECLAGL